jgi:hypothetical protein
VMVRMEVELPYTLESFTAEVQAKFKQGVAQSAGSTPDKVMIHSVAASEGGRLRRALQQAGSVDVDLSVSAATLAEASQLLNEGKLSLARLNQALDAAGVRRISAVRTAPSIEVAQRVESSTPTTDSESAAVRASGEVAMGAVCAMVLLRAART